MLFPGGPLALRIFEPRYLDMVSECLRNEHPFGVCLIQSGQEAGEAATPHLTGTFAGIVDWQRGDDGLLAISARGEQRFHVLDTRVEARSAAARHRATPCAGALGDASRREPLYDRGARSALRARRPRLRRPA